MKHLRVPSIHRYQSHQAFVRACIDALRESLLTVLDEQANVTLAVPGGRTISEILPTFAGADLPWDRIIITLVDERWVAPCHPDSNETQVRKLMREIANRARFRGLYSSTESPEEAIVALEQRISQPDIVLLAMGHDGHIGSLFPGTPVSASPNRYVVVSRNDHIRITLTFAAIGAARSIILPLHGAAKEHVFFAALSGASPNNLPVRYVLDHGAQVFIGPQ